MLENGRTDAKARRGIIVNHGAHVLGLAVAIGVLFSWMLPASSAAQGCVVTDGIAGAGSRVGSNPVRFQYESTPYIGARADTCKGNVRVLFGAKHSYFGGTERFRLNYGQRRDSRSPIFSHTVELPVSTVWGSYQKLFATQELEATVFAFFRVQSCVKPFLASSRCSPWSPIVTVALGRNELTAY